MSFSMETRDIQPSATQDLFGTRPPQPTQQPTQPQPARATAEPVNAKVADPSTASQVAVQLFAHWAEGAGRSASTAQVQRAAQQGIQGAGGAAAVS